MNKTIGVVSPGDMGHSVGARLVENGLRVIYCSEGRSERTRSLANSAGIEAVPMYADLVNQAEIVLSILVPAAAQEAAVLIAQAMQTTQTKLLYVDFNAIAPQTAQEIEHIITQAGGAFQDGSIIGGPPRGDYTPRMYISGGNSEKLAFLNDYGLNLISISTRAGDASALKMCYASLTKGSTALYLTLMTAARALGVYEPLIEEFQKSQSSRLQSIEQGIPRVTVKARRFVGEMEEMDKTYTSVGINPNMLKGAAEIYRLMGKTPLADRVPEDTSPFPSLAETLDSIIAHIEDD
jgi:3-hydroxyisobutyrate dehydrogenase-like beta-hydroxyacid dehydrogenase